jgi:hypothetical protein
MSSQIGNGARMSGVGETEAGEGLACLDGGSLTAGFFLLYKKGFVKKQQTMK